MVLEETRYQTDVRCDNGIILISTGLVALSIAVFISTASSVQPQFQLDATRQVLHFLFLRKTKQEKPKTPKQTNTPNLSSTTYILFCPMQKLRDGGGDQKNNTLKNSIIHPFKLFERALSLPKMFPEGGVFFCGLLQKLHVNNIPQQMPLLYGVEALSTQLRRLPLAQPPSPAATLESYLEWPGRAAKGFVKLPPVISPVGRIAHTHTQKHTYVHIDVGIQSNRMLLRFHPLHSFLL